MPWRNQVEPLKGSEFFTSRGFDAVTKRKRCATNH
uniref:Uncharacterized protein n=1 Tax=Anguilla anguilla TaxID=7936 RepID=A0A0E9V883_ANGAN